MVTPSLACTCLAALCAAADPPADPGADGPPTSDALGQPTADAGVTGAPAGELPTPPETGAPGPGATGSEATETVVAPGTDIATLSLEDLLNVQVVVASRRTESARESAAVITVFTREEIEATGARDLSELLRLVPGFTEHLDVENVVGLGVRGLWAYEGKVLLLVDGIDMTELLFSVNPLGMHYLTGIIERVEIVRGPGSAVYGGHAGMAVISVTTRGAKDLRGGALEARLGSLSRTYSDRSITLSLGREFDVGGGLGMSVNGVLGQGNRSEGIYTAPSGRTWDLSDHAASGIDPRFVTLGVTWKDLSARFLYDAYSVGTVDGYGDLTTVTREGEPVEAPVTQLFETTAAEVRYLVRLPGDVTVEPRLMVKRQRPWWVGDETTSIFYTKTVQRLGASLTATWAPTDSLHLLAGLEFFRDNAWVERPELVGEGAHSDFSRLNPDDPTRASLSTLSGFAQLIWENPIATLTLGGRAEWQSVAGSALVPRIAATRTFDRLTLKLLYSGAFRAPGFENLNLAEAGLEPERIQVIEGQVAYQLTDWSSVSVNAFAIDVEEPIVYTVDPDTNSQGYLNSGRIGSRGAEVEVHLRGRPGFLRASYSVAEASPHSDSVNFALPDTRARLAGMPQHSFALFGSLNLRSGFSLNPAAVWLGARAGFAPDGATDAFAPTLLVDFNARWEAPESSWLRGLSLTAGLHNLFDVDPRLIQPYNSGHPSMPARGRDFFARVGYAVRL